MHRSESGEGDRYLHTGQDGEDAMESERDKFWGSFAKLADMGGVIGLVALIAAFFFGITTARQCIDMYNEKDNQAQASGQPVIDDLIELTSKDQVSRCNNDLLQKAISKISAAAKITKYSIERNDCVDGKFPHPATVVFVLLQDQDTEADYHDEHSAFVLMVVDKQGRELAAREVRDIGRKDADSITDLSIMDFDADGYDEICYRESSGFKGPNLTEMRIDTIRSGKIANLFSVPIEAFDSIYSEGEHRYYNYTADVNLFLHKKEKTFLIKVSNTKLAKAEDADLPEGIILSDKPVWYQLLADSFQRLQ